VGRLPFRKKAGRGTLPDGSVEIATLDHFHFDSGTCFT
jgi:hypothetical protein